MLLLIKFLLSDIIGHFILIKNNLEKKHISIIYMQVAFILQRGHIKCTVAQKVH